MSWVILPGLGLTPRDFAPLAEALGQDVLTLDMWRRPVTDEVSALRTTLNPEGGRVDLLGHSLGGLAAVEWALRHPDEVGRLVLLDPTVPARRPVSLIGARGLLERAGTPLLSPSAGLAAPHAASIRRLAFRLSDRRPDPLTPREARQRYDSAQALRGLTAQWFASWDQEDRVARLIEGGAAADPRCPGRSAAPRPVHMVGLRGASRRWVAAQRRLSRTVDSHLHLLRGRGHLFPVTSPEVVLRLLHAHGMPAA